MSNRAQRRAIMRAEINRSQRMKDECERQIAACGRAGRIAGLVQNGITPDDVRREYERGRKDGFQEAGISLTTSVYAGVILALKDEFDFDEEQCFRAVKNMDQKIVWAIENAELAEQVLKETGIRLNMDDPLERVSKEG